MWRDDRVHDDLTVSRCRPTPWSCTTWLTTAADIRADIWDRDPRLLLEDTVFYGGTQRLTFTQFTTQHAYQTRPRSPYRTGLRSLLDKVQAQTHFDPFFVYTVLYNHKSIIKVCLLRHTTSPPIQGCDVNWVKVGHCVPPYGRIDRRS